MQSDVSLVDEQVLNLISARKSPAVIKARLITVRSRMPSVPIMAFEGVDDKIVYAKWISRIDETLRYEPFPCRGKDGLLELRTALDRDQTGLNVGVYYFIDRDFDGLKGRSNSENIFMTDKYSIENYLVSSEVLEKTLTDIFHCDGRPDVRHHIVETFRCVYGEFLSETSELNFRIYTARTLRLAEVGSITDKLSDIAAVDLLAVGPAIKSPEQVIALPITVPDAQESSLRASFNCLCPPDCYRGKFALMFFERWLDLLANEFDSRRTDLFSDIKRVEKVRRKELTLGHFATCSEIPLGLDVFIGAIQVAA